MASFAFIFLLVFTSGVASVGNVAAQENLDVTVNVPQEATTGEPTTLYTSVSVPDLPGDYENGLTITFYSDGQQIGSKTVTVSDGETADVAISHTFESTGDKEIRVEASTTVGGQEFSSSNTATLSVAEAQEQISIDGSLSLSLETPDSPQMGEETTTTVRSEIPSLTGAQSGELTLRLLVDGEETASKTLPVSGGESTETEFVTAFDSSGETQVTIEAVLAVRDQSVSKSVSRTVTVSEAPPGTETVEGAAFAVPESLEDEVEAYRDNISQDLEAQSFVLATQDELYIVFTRQEPTKGRVFVEGAVLDSTLSTENLTYGIIAATSTSFETTGTEVSVQEVTDNSEQYRLDVVRVNAQYRRLSTLTDTDEGENITLSSTSGVLVANPRSADSLFQNVGSNTRRLSQNTSTNQIDRILNASRGPHLHTFSFETAFWTDAEATVDAVVLDQQGAAQQFIEEYDQAGVAHAEDGAPILYVVEEDYQPQQVENVEAVKSRSESLDGEVVEIETRVYQEQISVQETLEHNTGCDVTLMEIQTPQGPVCVNIAQDNLLHGGVAWNSVPQSRDGALLVLGASSRHQDSPEEFEEGRYQIEGEVVSTSRINESLPEGSVLIIYDMERIDDIDYEAVAEESRAIIETRTGELTTRLRQQVGEEGIEIATRRSSKTIQSATPGNPTTVSFSQSARGSISVEQVSITVSTEVRNAQVNVAEISSLPSGVSQPPGQSIRILNISSSIAESNVQNASFQLRIPTAAIPADAEISLYRFHNGAWNAIETTTVEQGNSAVTITGNTPGLSYFSVGIQTAETESTDENGLGSDTTDESTPGFTVLSVILALLTVAAWSRSNRA